MYIKYSAQKEEGLVLSTYLKQGKCVEAGGNGWVSNNVKVTF